MGLFDSLFGGYGNQAVGKQVLMEYFQEAQKYPEFTYPSYDSWITWANTKVPEFDILIGELVNSISASSTVGEAADRVYQLANESAGQATLTQIVQSAGRTDGSVNWMAAIPDVATQSASQVMSIAQNVGTGLTSTLNMTKYLPWILGGAAVLYITVLAKGQGGALGKLLGKK